MGLGTMFKANKAYRAQQKGDTAEAMRLYAECIGDGLVDPRYLLSYAALLIRYAQDREKPDFRLSGNLRASPKADPDSPP